MCERDLFRQLLPILRDKAEPIDGVKLAIDARCVILTAPGKNRVVSGGDSRNACRIGMIATPGDRTRSGPAIGICRTAGQICTCRANQYMSIRTTKHCRGDSNADRHARSECGVHRGDKVSRNYLRCCRGTKSCASRRGCFSIGPHGRPYREHDECEDRSHYPLVDPDARHGVWLRLQSSADIRGQPLVDQRRNFVAVFLQHQHVAVAVDPPVRKPHERVRHARLI